MQFSRIVFDGYSVLATFGFSLKRESLRVNATSRLQTSKLPDFPTSSSKLPNFLTSRRFIGQLLDIFRLDILPTGWLKFRALGPDVLSLVASLACCYFASTVDRRQPRQRTLETKETRHYGRTIFHLSLLCLTSITDPSFFNAPYFATFLIALTVCCFAGRHIVSDTSLTLMKRIGSWFAALQLLAIYTFQLPSTSSDISSEITR
jgi:hypothetical protein